MTSQHAPLAMEAARRHGYRRLAPLVALALLLPAGGGAQPCLARQLGPNASTVATGAARAESLRLFSARALAVGVTGSLLLSDSAESVVNVLTQSGFLSRFCGDGVVDYVNGPALSSRVAVPSAMGVTADNSLVFAELPTGSLRMVRSSDAVVVPLAGTGAPAGRTVLVDGAPGTRSSLRRPRGAAVTGTGWVYSSSPDCVIFGVHIATGVLRSVAGTVGVCGVAGDGGPAANATLLPMRGLAVTPDGAWLFASDSFSTVRAVALRPPGGGPPTIHGVMGAPDSGSSPPPIGMIVAMALDPATATLYCIGLQTQTVYALDVGAVLAAAGPLPATFAPAVPPPVRVVGNGRLGSLGDGGPAASASLAVALSLGLSPNPLVAWAAAGGGVGSSAAAVSAAANAALRPAARLYIAEYMGGVRSVDLTTPARTITRVLGPPLLAAGATLSAAVAFADETAEIVWTGGRLYVVRASLGFGIVEVEPLSWSVRTIAGNGEGGRAPDDAAVATAVPLHLAAFMPAQGDLSAYCLSQFFSLSAAAPLPGGGGGGSSISSPTLRRLLLTEGHAGRVRLIEVDGNIHTLFGAGGVLAPGATLPLPAPGGGGGSPAMSTVIGVPRAAYPVRDGTDDVMFVFGGNDTSCVAAGTQVDFRDAYVAVGRYHASTQSLTLFACDRAHGGDAASGPNVGPAAEAHCCQIATLVALPSGDVVLVDQCDHALRIVYTNGTMAVLAGTRGVAGFAGDGGPFRDALFDTPVGSALSPDGNTLYITDQGNARVRALDLVGGNITTVVGNGGTWDRELLQRAPNTPPTEVGIGSPTSGGQATAPITVDDHGNLLLSVGGAVWRTVGVGAAAGSLCPVGHTCGCGPPAPCTDASAACPGGRDDVLRGVGVNPGYHAVAAPSPVYGYATGAASVFVGQAPCPPGAYCTAGVLNACPAGSYGSSAFMYVREDCAPCPAGTASALPGQTDAGACVPCAPGTYAGAPGSAHCTLCPVNTAGNVTGGVSASAACFPCGPGAVAPPGSPGCTPLGSTAVASTVDGVLTVEAGGSGSSGTTGVERTGGSGLSSSSGLGAIGAATAGSLVQTLQLSVALPFVLTVLAALVVGVAVPPLRRRLAACLRNSDALGLAHYVPDGASPVKRVTARGGSVTLLTAATIAALGAALIVQFLLGNVLLSRSVLPASLAAQADAAGLPLWGTRDGDGRPAAGAIPAAAPAIAGVSVEVAVFSPGCVAGWAGVEWAATGVSGGGFAPLPGAPIVVAAAGPRAASHMVFGFACSACVFTPLSALVVRFPPACQSFRVAATAVSSEGVAMLTLFAAAGDPASGTARASSDSSGGNATATSSAQQPLLALSALAAEVAPTLEVFTPAAGSAAADAGRVRGYRLAASGVAPTLVAAGSLRAGDRVTIALSLPLSPWMVSATVSRITSTPQLLSSLVGLAGLATVARLLYAFAEHAWRSEGCKRARRGCGGGGGGKNGGDGSGKPLGAAPDGGLGYAPAASSSGEGGDPGWPSPVSTPVVAAVGDAGLPSPVTLPAAAAAAAAPKRQSAAGGKRGSTVAAPLTQPPTPQAETVWQANPMDDAQGAAARAQQRLQRASYHAAAHSMRQVQLQPVGAGHRRAESVAPPV